MLHCAMAAANLPGLYKDPITARYGPGGSNEDCRNLPLQIAKMSCVRKRPNSSNVVDFLIDREIGSFPGVEAPCKYFKLKFLRKTSVEDIDLDFAARCSVGSVEYVKGGPKSVLGLFNSSDPEFSYAIGGMPRVNMDPNLYLGFFGCDAYIQDMCELPGAGVFHDTVVYIYNDSEEQGIIKLVWKDSSDPNGFKSMSHYHSPSAPLYCCSVTGYSSRMSIGGENFLSYYDGISHVKSFDVVGKVMTTAIDDTGTFIISGRNDGFVHLYDTRLEDGHPFCFQAEKNKKCLLDSLFLTTERIILAGASNELYLVLFYCAI